MGVQKGRKENSGKFIFSSNYKKLILEQYRVKFHNKQTFSLFNTKHVLKHKLNFVQKTKYCTNMFIKRII
jgi:hypothetical protein